MLINICRRHLHQAPSIPLESRAWEIHHFAPSLQTALENELRLTHTRHPPPVSHPDDVLVQSQAASVNPIDNLTLTGYGSSFFRAYRRLRYNVRQGDEFPFTPGRDFAGVVVEAGPGALSRSFSPGTPVMGATMPYTSTLGGGCLSDYVLCRADIIAKRPEKLDPIRAAAVSYAGLTAWSAVRSGGMDPSKKSGDTPKRVLVTGVTGPVGALSVQLAKIAGASHLTVTIPSRAKDSDIKASLGVDEVSPKPSLSHWCWFM